MALRELHPGAIYLHGGRSYIVVDLRARPWRAVVRRVPADLDLVTQALYTSMPREGARLGVREVRGVEVEYLELSIRDSVYGYVVRRFGGGETLDERLLDREYSYDFRTKGILISLAPEPGWSEMENAEAFHAAEHALITAAQMVLGASQTDLGGVSFPSGHIYIYDSYPGGSGVARMAMERMEEVLRRAYELVSGCRCEDGCPRCIYSPYCGNNNKILSRRRAEKVLGAWLVGEMGRPVERSGRPVV